MVVDIGIVAWEVQGMNEEQNHGVVASVASGSVSSVGPGPDNLGEAICTRSQCILEGCHVLSPANHGDG